MRFSDLRCFRLPGIDAKEVDPRVRPTVVDMDRVQSTIKQIVRDWSSAGAEERAKCYDPLLVALDSLHPDNRHLVKVLVPGSGLARLAWEIASRGYECQGTEFSLYMLFASNFLQNKAVTATRSIPTSTSSVTTRRAGTS